jgi:hypothetical protein
MEKLPTLKEILQFISDRHFVQPWELANQFHYTPRFAQNKTYRLHKSGLIKNAEYGKYNLSYDGLRRLAYLNEREKKERKDVLKARQEGYQEGFKKARLISIGVCEKCGIPLAWDLNDPNNIELLSNAVNGAQYIHSNCS